MGGIKAFVVLPVAALNLAVMPWRVGADQLMPDAVLFQVLLEEGGLVPVRGEAVGKFSSIIGLDALNGAGEGFHKVLHKEGGRISALFLKSLNETPSGILINGGILEEMLSDDVAVYKAGGRDKFDIYLNALSGMVHLLVRLGNIFRIGRMNRHHAQPFQEAVEAGDGTGIAALPEFDPKDNKPHVRVASAHIRDQLDLIRGMLVGMVVRPSGAVAQGLDGAVITAFPTVNILPVGLIFNGSFGNAVFFSIFD